MYRVTDGQTSPVVLPNKGSLGRDRGWWPRLTSQATTHRYANQRGKGKTGKQCKRSNYLINICCQTLLSLAMACCLDYEPIRGTIANDFIHTKVEYKYGQTINLTDSYGDRLIEGYQASVVPSKCGLLAIVYN